MASEASTVSPTISIRFWGVRGSIACPGATTSRYGGNTACVEVRCGDNTLIFDAGTGIRALGNALVQARRISEYDIFLSHGHIDHVASVVPVCGAHDVPAWIHPEDRFMMSDPEKALGRTIGMLGETLVSSLGAQDEWPSPIDPALIAVGLVTMAAGLIWCARRAQPLPLMAVLATVLILPAPHPRT